MERFVRTRGRYVVQQLAFTVRADDSGEIQKNTLPVDKATVMY